jgi:hypothetical protein
VSEHEEECAIKVFVNRLMSRISGPEREQEVKVFLFEFLVIKSRKLQ